MWVDDVELDLTGYLLINWIDELTELNIGILLAD